MSYTVLARRYRSNAFDEVVGQDAVVRTLKNALAADRVAHAYLFTGTRGVGKTTMARILAKALNCLASDKPTITPCGRCDSCRGIAEGQDLDVIEIDAASNTQVEHVRELRQNVIYRPARARFKIYIIDEVHMLSSGAFNALLKTLEEPPDHVKFILATTQLNKVPLTIRSRCQHFEFRNLSGDEIAAQLDKVLLGENRRAEPPLIRRVARLARGSLRDALSLLDQLLSMTQDDLTLPLLAELLGTPRSQRLAELVAALAAGQISLVLQRTDAALADGLSPEVLADALQDYFRDLMVLRHCPPDTDLLDADPAARTPMIELARSFDDAALVYNITVLEELRRALRFGASGRALLDAALVRLAAAERFSDTRTLLEQLAQLQIALAASPTPAASASRMSPPAPANTPPRSHPAPVAEPKLSPPPAAPTQPDLPETLSLDYLQEHWPRLLAALAQRGAQHVEAYLRPARPLELQQGLLTLGFAAHEGMGRFLAGQPAVIAEIEKALAELLLRPLRLRLESLPTPPVAPPSHAPPPAAPARSPGAKPSQKEINQALADPKVRSVLETFNGKVRRVERGSNP